MALDSMAPGRSTPYKALASSTVRHPAALLLGSPGRITSWRLLFAITEFHRVCTSVAFGRTSWLNHIEYRTSLEQCCFVRSLRNSLAGCSTESSSNACNGGIKCLDLSNRSFAARFAARLS